MTTSQLSNLSLGTERRMEFLDRLANENPISLLFSERLALEEEFIESLAGTNTLNCPMNFLAWLSHSKYARAVGKALLENK